MSKIVYRLSKFSKLEILMSFPGVALTYLVAISLLSVVYTGPNSSNENNLNLFEMLRDISLNNPSHLLIVGDFNWTD